MFGGEGGGGGTGAKYFTFQVIATAPLPNVNHSVKILTLVPRCRTLPTDVTSELSSLYTSMPPSSLVSPRMCRSYFTSTSINTSRLTRAIYFSFFLFQSRRQKLVYYFNMFDFQFTI